MSRMTVKDRKGTAAAERRKRRAAIERAETTAKNRAKSRDGLFCRRCEVALWPFDAEAAHLRSKGAGGDHGLHSSSPADYVTLCHECHQGPRSLHSGHVRVEFGPAGGDGPVTFHDQVPGARHGRCAVDGGVHAQNQFCKAFRPQ